MTENKILNGTIDWSNIKFNIATPDLSIIEKAFKNKLSELLQPEIVNRAVLDKLDTNKCGVLSCKECYK